MKKLKVAIILHATLLCLVSAVNADVLYDNLGSHSDGVDSLAVLGPRLFSSLEYFCNKNSLVFSNTEGPYQMELSGTSAVPESAIMILVGLGLIGLAAYVRKKFSKEQISQVLREEKARAK